MNESVIYGILVMAIYGITDSIAKIPSSKMGAKQAIFARGIFVLITLGTLLLFQTDLKYSIEYMIYSVLLGALAYIPIMLLYKALSEEKVGIVLPIVNCSSVVALILGVIFASLILTIKSIIAIIIIFCGIFILTYKHNDAKSSSSKTILYSIISAILFGISYLLFIYVTPSIDPILFAFLYHSGIFITSYIHMKISKESLISSEYYVWLSVALIGVLISFATFFYSIGILTSNPEIVIALYGANPIIGAIIARVVFNEKLYKKEIFGLIIATVGIILLSL